MKIKLLAISLLSLGSAHGAITVAVSNTSSVLTNLTVDGTSNTQRLVWGIIVDADGDGYDTGSYIGSTTGAILSTKLGPQSLYISTTTASDDVLYLAGAVFSVAGTGDGSTGLARPLSATNIALTGNVGVGDNFAIVWFDLDNLDLGGSTTIVATANTTVPTLAEGLKYGVLTSSGAISHTIPTDGQTRDLTANFTGADVQRTATFALAAVPEPSAALLGMLGALGLLRRRR